MLRVEDALDGLQNDVREGQSRPACSQHECARLIQPAVFGLELGECVRVTRVCFRTAENDLTANVSARERREVGATRDRLGLSQARATQMLDDDGEPARVVSQCY